MKLLFISSKDVHTTIDGGFLCTNRNYRSFCTLLGEKNVDVIDLSNEPLKDLKWKITKRINYLKGFYEGLTLNKIGYIIHKATKTDFVFIDDSIYGIVAYYLRKAKYKGKIISFFHNVEYKIELQKTKINPLHFWKKFITRYNEKSAFEFSDKRIALNERDAEDLKNTYGIKPISIIPISLIDKVKELDQSISTSIPPTCVFLGSSWYANVQGLNWFIKHVLDKVDIRLQVAGKGMDSMSKRFSHPKIEFIGYVPDLALIISGADFIISPIFSGSGMKVKTCEALMYGKNIIGTKEAFEGYEVDFTKVGALCNNSVEFIYALNNLALVKRERFNAYSRNYFIKNHSFQATIKKFQEVIESAN